MSNDKIKLSINDHHESKLHHAHLPHDVLGLYIVKSFGANNNENEQWVLKTTDNLTKENTFKTDKELFELKTVDENSKIKIYKLFKDRQSAIDFTKNFQFGFYAFVHNLHASQFEFVVKKLGHEEKFSLIHVESKDVEKTQLVKNSKKDVEVTSSKTTKTNKDSNFAIILSGGKQILVQKDLSIFIEKIDGQEGDKITFDKIVLLNDKIGKPFVEQAVVIGLIEKQGKQKKIVVYRHNAKSTFKRKYGHRQPYTRVKIMEIKG